MYLSKKVKLPKSQWVKGKSKFLFIRLAEESGFNKPRLKVNKAIVLTWQQKLYAFIRRIFTKVKKRYPLTKY